MEETNKLLDRDENICAMSKPAPGEAGRTGDWRDLKPVIDDRKCVPVIRNKPSCFLCWLYCPEGVVSAGFPIKIDYDYCKGCGICAEECPAKAISMVEEDK